MQARRKPSRDLARPERGPSAPGVLLVGQAPAALKALAAQVLAALPKARIEMLSSTTELAFGLVSKDVSIVILDSAHLDETPPSLLSLPRRATSALQLAFVGAPHDAPHAIDADALPAWLLRSARAGALSLKSACASISPVAAAGAAITTQPPAADAALGDL